MAKLLFIPSVRPGGGYGHLKRCLEAAAATGGKVWAPEGRPPGVEDALWHEAGAEEGTWDALVVDRRCCETPLFRRLRRLGLPLLGWDEGGVHRSAMDYLVDTLGNLCHHRPNLRDPLLIDWGPARRYVPAPLHRALVAFGGDDRRDLAGRLLAALGRLPPRAWSVDLLEGPFQHRRRDLRLWGRPVPVIRHPNLREILPNYGLVFCSYGLTAREALRQGVPVLLCQPSWYHWRLAHQEGLPQLGVGGPRRATLSEWLARIEAGTYPQEVFTPWCGEGEPHAVWTRWQAVRPLCSACGARLEVVVHRRPEGTFYRCSRCGLGNWKPYLVPPRQYGGSYFSEEYRAQYGRTYREDFSHIQALGAARLARLTTLAGPLQGKTLLDLGCALGPFLVAARNAGMEVMGLDVSAEAVAFVREQLGLAAEQGDLREARRILGGKSFDVVTAWYVIEHLPELGRALDVIAGLVRPGGWFALSTPNAAGLTARLRPRRFLDQSPTDHCTLWGPKVARKVLARYGFDLIQWRPTGIHPERILDRPLPEPWYRAAAWALRWLGWGDTLELYCRRRP